MKEIAWAPTGDEILVGAVEEIYGDELIKSKLLLISVADKSVKPFGDRTWYNANSFYWTKEGDNLLMVGKSSEQESAQIWEISYPDGENARRLTNDTSGYVMMGLARETGTIVGTKQNIISSIWTQNADGKDLKQIVPESSNFTGSNTITPMADGRVLVSKNADGKINFSIINVDGKEEKTLSTNDAMNYQAAFSPDNQQIVFGSSRNRVGGIWRMNADGTNPIQLTKSENSLDSKPLVLPDNKTVVFERRLPDMNKATLMKISTEGGEPAPLFSENAYMETSPRLSADGKHFAYSGVDYDRANNKFDRFVRVMAVDGGNIGKLERQFDLNLGWNYRFAPDGKSLTYVNIQKSHNLYSLPLDGSSQQKQLTNFTSGIVLNFAWSQDGKKIYIVRGIVNNELVLLKNSAQKA
jgi:TolB protein